MQLNAVAKKGMMMALRSKFAFVILLSPLWAAMPASGFAQSEDDFWSESQQPDSVHEPQEDFWSDTKTATAPAPGDFWASSSADEVERKREIVLAERAAVERRRQAERARKRKLAELERLQAEERQAQMAFERRRMASSRSGGGDRTGGWGAVARAAQVFAGTMDQELRTMERNAAQSRERQARLNADRNQMRSAAADRSQRMADLQREVAEANRAAEKAGREARLARERQNFSRVAATDRGSANPGAFQAYTGDNWCPSLVADAAEKAKMDAELERLSAMFDQSDLTNGERSEITGKMNAAQGRYAAWREEQRRICDAGKSDAPSRAIRE
jgi:hypothetical protein